MSASQGPTPCPLPRFPQRHTHSKLAPLAEEAAQLPPGILRDAKPRRPLRKTRKSPSWDPTVDIYDDTFDFKRTAAPPAPAQLPSDLVSNTSAHALSGSRSSSLWAQPAQKLSLDTDIKRRRVSTLPKPEHVSISQPQQSRLPSNPGLSSNCQPYLGKDPRRRTIYVPSEDTTVMTIHPGASLRDSISGPRRPRRSDIFLDLATCLESDADQHAEVRQPRKAPRKSLSVAPRKPPLQPTSRSYQPNTPPKDVAGAGGGKENLPPGKFQVPDTAKPDQDNTCFLKASARRVSVAAPKDKLASPRVAHLKSPGRNEPLRAVDVNSPSKAAPKRSLSSLSANATADPTAHLDLPANGQYSNSSKRISLSPSQVTHVASAAAKLNVPSIPQQSRWTASLYPVLSEDVPSSEMYEENWLSHQECVISELINNLFEKACQSEECPLLEGSALRKQLIDMYHDPALLLLHKRLKASLQFGALKIATDSLSQVSRYKDDLQQRQRFLDLWIKTYNLQSLQSIAEVVVGREVSLNPRLSVSPPRMQSFNTAVSRNKYLEIFLKSFVIRNDDTLTKKTSNSTLTNEGSWEADYGSAEWMWRRTVVRSLMIILLLDKAQTAGIFKGCLFQSTSPFKSSTAVLQAFGSLMLPFVGNVLRVLEHLSYRVEHVQHSFQEQIYRISNLAVDLRDGVLLTRLVEILLYPPSSLEPANDNITITLFCGDELTSVLKGPKSENSWPLSQHLKHHCHSRVQKLYNVQIALSALASLDEFRAVLQNISPEDIVDGHREKTVSLLWSIVGKWGLGTLVDFDLVEREVRRLEKRWREMKEKHADTSGIQDDEFANSAYPTGRTGHAAMLKQWARNAARLHGVNISNSSTSFFGGQAYKAIAAEYAEHVEAQLPPTSPQSPKAAARLSSFSSSSRSNIVGPAADPPGDTALIGILTRFGCSQAFISLFRDTNRMPSKQTTIPLLAFLASRFIPPSQPHFAAITIQHAWRRNRMRHNLRRRVILAVLARDCAIVVTAREQIEHAAIVLQRWWRKIAMC